MKCLGKRSQGSIGSRFQPLTVFGSPVSISTAAKSATGAKENGATGVELDDASKRKAESRLLAFYEVHAEPNATAQGPADFN